MIALYCRLSVADGDGGESDSIANQRLILADFIASCDDLKGEEHRFFVDDGISGTHAENRPALQEMLRCCREGRVSTVVVCPGSAATTSTASAWSRTSCPRWAYA